MKNNRSQKKWMLLLYVVGLMLFPIDSLLAQHAHFVTGGVIEFEKRINTYAIVNKRLAAEPSPARQQELAAFKAAQPQFRVLKSKLYFSKAITKFEPLDNGGIKSFNNYFDQDPMLKQVNTVYHDFTKEIKITQKNFLENNYLIKDTIRKIVWRITDETREIAGYKCKRANGLVSDSIYVVAFYTESIQISAGPESFGGLPGMILGLAMPYENVTWFATKVTERHLLETETLFPMIGKPVDVEEFLKIMKVTLGNYRDPGNKLLKGFVL